MRILTFIVVLLLSGFSFGQIAFFHLYSSDGDDMAEGVCETEDSSYIITGSTDGFPGGFGSQAFLMKIDSLGIPIWSHHYGGLEMDQGKRVAYKQDYGIYMAGTTSSIGEGNYDFYLVKTDVDGGLQWEKSYGRPGWERLHDAVMTRDTGMVMVGQTLSNPTNNSDMYIVRTNKMGDTLWTKTLGGLGDDCLKSVCIQADSTFYVAGHTYVDDSMFVKAYIARYHENGTLMWSDTLGADGNYYVNDVNVDVGEVYCVGYRNGPNVEQNDHYFNRFLHDGTYLSEITETLAGDWKVHQVCTAAGGKRYMGYTYFTATSQQDGDDLAIARANFVFSVEATALNLYYLDPDVINDLTRTSDGGAIAVGQTSSEGWPVGVHHGYVCKIGPNELYANWDAPHIIFGLVVGVDEVIEDHLSVYPNPTDGVLNISSSNNDAVNIQLVNSLGQIVLERDMNGSIQLDLSSFNSGVYFLRTNAGGVQNVRKVVVN